MIANGHQTIGYMGIKSQESFSSEREEGFCEAMASHQLSVDKVCKVSVFNSARNAQTKAMSYLMEVNITAIVCASDEIAFGVIEAAKELKIDVPKDLSVIGFDGSVYSEMSRPRITTVKQEVYDIGRSLAKILLKRIDTTDEPVIQELIDLELIENDSVKSLKE